ncbi:hypothetical protein EMCRGX_G029313 [Ephydatia muelleri]
MYTPLLGDVPVAEEEVTSLPGQKRSVVSGNWLPLSELNAGDVLIEKTAWSSRKGHLSVNISLYSSLWSPHCSHLHTGQGHLFIVITVAYCGHVTLISSFLGFQSSEIGVCLFSIPKPGQSFTIASTNGLCWIASYILQVPSAQVLCSLHKCHPMRRCSRKCHLELMRAL